MQDEGRKGKTNDKGNSERLATKANKATIAATGIAVLALFVAVLSLLVTYFDIRGELGAANEHLRAIRDEMQSIEMTIGIHDGTVFVRWLTVEHNYNGELLVQTSFRNVSGFNSVGGRIVLPDYLGFVMGSATLFDWSNPNGRSINDGIVDRFIDLGAYSTFDDNVRGSGSISFRVRFTDRVHSLGQGEHSLNIVAFLGGYVDEIFAKDSQSAYASVVVVNEEE